MRKRISNHLKLSSIYRGGVFTLILFLTLLVSCENFLNGADIKREIEEQIAYANAPKTTIRVSLASSDYGSVYPTEIKGAAGDSFTIEFKKKSGIEFKGWTCFDANGQDSDAVTFSDESTTEDKENRTENYTVKATIKSVQDGIEIRPKCYNPTENIKPEFTVLRIAKTKEDAENGTNLITLDEFSHYAAAASYSGTEEEKAAAKKQGIDNHHVNSFWFYFESDDTGGGVESLEVSEKLIRTTEGVAVTNTALKTVYQNNGGLNSFSGAFEYNFKNLDDGVVNLNFVVTDYSGNETSFGKTLDLVKDTTANLGTCMLISDKLCFLEPNQDTIHYEFVVAPIPGYGFFATDMDGITYEEGWGDRYHINGGGEYHGHLMKLLRIETGYSEESFSALSDANITYCENDTYICLRSGNGGRYSGDFYRISFDCNPYKDFYIRTVMSDDVGNENYTSFHLNKAIDVVSCEYDSITVTMDKKAWRNSTSDSWQREQINFESPIWNVRLSSISSSSQGARLFAIRQDDDGNIDKEFINDNLFGIINWPERIDTYNSYACVNNSFSHRVWDITERTSTLATWGFVDCDAYLTQADGDDESELYLCDDGIYNIYCFTYHSADSWHTAYISCTGKPITVYKGVPKPQVSAPSTSDLPSDFTINLEPSEKSSGKQKVHIEYPTGFTPNPNLTYIVNYSHPATGSYSKLDENSSIMDFEIPTEYCTYNFKIIAYNTSGEKAETTVKQVTVTYDTIPPEYDSYSLSCIYFPNAVVYENPVFSDDKSGLLKKDGKVLVKYFFTYTKYIERTLTEVLKANINWDSTNIRTTSYTEGKELVIPFDGASGSYLYIQVSDNNGNTIAYEEIPPTELINAPSLSYSNSKLNINSDAEMSTIVVQYINNNTWTTSYRKNYGYHSSDSVDITAESNHFIRVQACKGGWEGSIYKTAYAYLPYLQSPSSNTPELADFTVGNRGVNVFSDKPVLVHTFWASSNLGSNVEDWLYGGVETGVVQKSGSFTYTSDRLGEIPDGKYYATIIHYADGTMSMTEVKKK